MSYEVIDERWGKFMLELLSTNSHSRLTNAKGINSWHSIPSSTLCWVFSAAYTSLYFSAIYRPFFFWLFAFLRWDNRLRSLILTSFSDGRIQSGWRVIIQYHSATDRSFFVCLTYWCNWHWNGSRSLIKLCSKKNLLPEIGKVLSIGQALSVKCKSNLNL